MDTCTAGGEEKEVEEGVSEIYRHRLGESTEGWLRKRAGLRASGEDLEQFRLIIIISYLKL